MEFFETKNNELKLSIIGDDEPNYGRMLKIVKVEKNNIDTRLAIEKSLEMHSKFLIQIYHEHYLLRKSINKNAKV